MLRIPFLSHEEIIITNALQAGLEGQGSLSSSVLNDFYQLRRVIFFSIDYILFI